VCKSIYQKARAAKSKAGKAWERRRLAGKLSVLAAETAALPGTPVPSMFDVRCFPESAIRHSSFVILNVPSVILVNNFTPKTIASHSASWNNPLVTPRSNPRR
jgi:hypothetical protein